MPRSDGLKFKHTIIDLNFARAPEGSHLRSVIPEAPTTDTPFVSTPFVSTPFVSTPFVSTPSVKTPVTRADKSVETPLAQTTIRMPTTDRPAKRSESAPPPPPEPAVEPPSVEVSSTPPDEHESHATLMRWTDTEAIVRTGIPPGVSFVLETVEIPVDVDRRLVMLYAHASDQARAYRLLRHRLLAQSDPRILAVTSAEPGEGKTTCAANLALALADETMSRVLLVEANLRRPSLGEVFGYEPSDSFVRRLVDHRDASPPYPVAGVHGTRLHVAALPSRRQREMRLDRLLFSTALHELRSAYDYIVIDSAAVLESADADVAGECADGVILVTRAQVSRKSAVKLALEQLHPTRILGTVVIDT